MKVVVQVTRNRLPQIKAAFQAAANQIVEETLDEIETTIKVGMNEPKSGRRYRRGERWHQASAPGEMPAVDTGNLANSIQKQPPEATPDGGAAGLIFTNAEYAPYLEYGTGSSGSGLARPDLPFDEQHNVNAGGMEPRPFMTPAAEIARSAFVEKFKDLETRMNGLLET